MSMNRLIIELSFVFTNDPFNNRARAKLNQAVPKQIHE